MSVTHARTGLGQLRALVVEDNEHMRLLLRTLLQAMDVRRVTERRDGASALADLEMHKPDFILSDLSMAPMDGIEFTRKLRSGSEAIRLTPIIMVTGHTERRRVEMARDAGVNEILAKPITVAGMYQRIEEIILRPRAYVRSTSYFGPDRRRHAQPGFTGPFRRKSDSEIDAVDDYPGVNARAGA